MKKVSDYTESLMLWCIAVVVSLYWEIEKYEELEKNHITMLNSFKKYCNINKKAYDRFKGQLDEMLQEE